MHDKNMEMEDDGEFAPDGTVGAERTGQWMDPSERPQRERFVPLLLQSDTNRYWVRAMFVGEKELEIDDQDPWDGCTEDEATGAIYCPSGWYEDQDEETVRLVKDKPVAWFDLRFPK